LIGAPTILVLGGYGETGRRVSRLLLAHTNAHVVIAGRRMSRASAACDELNREFVGLRARPRYGDAKDSYTLTAALAGVDLVVVAATTAEHAPRVAEAAMAAGADYLDCHFDQGVGPALSSLDGRAREVSHCLITQAGLFPGLPGVLVRALAGVQGRVERGRVAMAVSYQMTRPESAIEVVRIARQPQGDVLRDGKWRKGGWGDTAVFDFGGSFGRRRCYPLEMLEMREAANLFGLREGGLYIGGVNWFVDGVVFPLIMALGGAGSGGMVKPLSRLLAWGANTFTTTKPGAVVLAEGDGASIRIELGDPNELAAMAIVACVRQWIGGRLRRPGVLLAGLAADPAAMLEDLARFGAAVRTSGPVASPASGQSPSAPPA